MYRFYNNIIIKSSKKMEAVLIILTVTYFVAPTILLFVASCAMD